MIKIHGKSWKKFNLSFNYFCLDLACYLRTVNIHFFEALLLHLFHFFKNLQLELVVHLWHPSVFCCKFFSYLITVGFFSLSSETIDSVRVIRFRDFFWFDACVLFSFFTRFLITELLLIEINLDRTHRHVSPLRVVVIFWE